MTAAPSQTPVRHAAGARPLGLVAMLGLGFGLVMTAGGPAAGDDPRPAAASTPLDADREAAALAFVRTHHPELATLLESLKPMRPAEYEKAIRQISQVSRSLQAVAATDPRRYELGLEAWKARSRVELLTARLASRGESSPSTSGVAGNRDLEAQLRQAVAAQLDVETRQQRYEREQAEARVRRLNESIQRLEADPSSLVESRYQALLKKSQRASGRVRLGGVPAKSKSAAPGGIRARIGAAPAPNPSNNARAKGTPSTPPNDPSEGERPR